MSLIGQQRVCKGNRSVEPMVPGYQTVVFIHDTSKVPYTILRLTRHSKSFGLANQWVATVHSPGFSISMSKCRTSCGIVFETSSKLMFFPMHVLAPCPNWYLYQGLLYICISRGSYSPKESKLHDHSKILFHQSTAQARRDLHHFQTLHGSDEQPKD